MTVTVDARGLACPQPVILARRAMREDEGNEIVTIVDNEIAQHNVSRMATKAGYGVGVQERADGFYIRLIRSEPAQSWQPEAEYGRAGASAGPLVLVVAGDQMGRGPAELGQVLIRGFLHTLGEVEPRPDTLVFVNEGVRLTAAGSPVVDDLRELAENGVQVLACGTCLGFFGLKDQVAVGEVSNMYTIAETMLRAGKVVTL